jgi:hypothetical protein
MRYLMTHSLLYSWLYAMKENPNADATTERDQMEEFMLVLRREPTPTSEAMQNGIDFEELVTQIVYGMSPEGDSWGEAAAAIANRVRGGVLQYKAYRNVQVGGLTMLLNGRLDCLRAGEIFDIKFSKSYEPGKYFDSTQHPMYFELIPEARSFTYLVSNGSLVWSETYRRDETQSIIPTIENFLAWLGDTGLMPLYLEKWEAR